MNFKWSWFIYWTCPSRAEAPTTQVRIDEINFFCSAPLILSRPADLVVSPHMRYMHWRYKQKIPSDSRLSKWKEEATDRKKKNNENKLTKFVDIQFLISSVGCFDFELNASNEMKFIHWLLWLGELYRFDEIIIRWNHKPFSAHLVFDMLQQTQMIYFALVVMTKSMQRFYCAKSAGKRTIILCSNNRKSTFYGCLSRLQRWDFSSFRNSVRISRA